MTWQRRHFLLPTILLAGAAAVAGFAATPPTFTLTVIHSFPAAGPLARNPQTPLAAGPEGILYGTTTTGGRANQGVLFQIRTNGAEYLALHHFTKQPGNGGGPMGELLRHHHRLFGVTEAGAGLNGTLFAFDTRSRDLRILHGFAPPQDAQFPAAGPIRGSDGNLYGTTDRGGQHGQGAVYSLRPDGSGYRVLHHFKAAQGDGGNPKSALVETADGFLHGTTSAGGRFGLGTLFRIRKNGSGYQLLHHFAGGNQDGAIPMAPLIDDGFGHLFGVTRGGGGPAQGGAVFRIRLDGSAYRMLHGFTGVNQQPRLPGDGLALTPAGWILGITMSGGQRQMGTIFLMDKEGESMRVLHHFMGHNHEDGAHPTARLIRAGESFYGTTEKGGAHNAGTLYRLDLASPPAP